MIDISQLENVNDRLSKKEVELIMHLIDILFWSLDHDEKTLPS